LAGPWVHRTRLSGLGLFASLEAALAAVGLAALLLVNALPSLYVSVFRGLLGPLHEGALAGSQLAVAGALVFLPCLIMGMIFPAAVRAFREAGRDGSPESNVGRLYVWNTIGGIAGSLVTGFVLLPRFGVWSTMTGAAVGSLLVASGVAGVAIARAGSFLRVRRDLIGMVPGVLAVLTVVWFIPRWNIADFNRGRYRFLYSATSDQEKLDPGQLIYHREGVNVSVAVYRGLGAASLHIGGKPDASTNLSDILTQCLSGHLPLMFAPRIEKVGVVGYGSGMTAGAALTHPEVRELDLMEIEEAVIDASVYFDCISDDPLDDPRTHLLVEDGRVHLTYAPDKYDVLISEPSNPWMAGIANLFTREFYEIVRDHLEPDGVLAQWIQNYDLTEEAFGAILAALHDSFPHLMVFQTNPADMIVLASQEPLRAPWERVQERFSDPAVRRSLLRANVRDPLELGFFLVAPEAAVIELAQESRQRNTDDNAWLEHHAPLHLLRRVLGESRAIFAARGLAERGAPYRSQALAEVFPGIPYVEALNALVWYPHRLEPGTFQPQFYDDPWAELRSIQIPALERSLGAGPLPALADSVRLWEARGVRYRELRAGAARSLDEARFRGETAQVLPRISRMAPDLSVVRFEEGVAAMAAGDTTAAAREFGEVLRKPQSPACYYALIGMAQLSWQAGDADAALRWADAAAAYNPYYANGFAIGAQLAQSRGDATGANERLQRGLVFNPHHRQLEELLGR
ncbi:MAG: hypothetical protein KC729_08690, partial [Candidatus Eisenbacteria bacterium]|nr:hypothetical protein [Candidatus Eisenbacteria bacterium]